METLTYQPPLRGAVLFAVGMRCGAVSIETLAELAQVAEDRARAFASILIARGALEQTPMGLVPGPAWDEWSTRPVRSRPQVTTDRKALAEIDGMRLALATRVRAALRLRRWRIRELSRRAGIHHQYVVQLTRYGSPPPVCHLVLLARVLDTTVEALVAPLPPPVPA